MIFWFAALQCIGIQPDLSPQVNLRNSVVVHV